MLYKISSNFVLVAACLAFARPKGISLNFINIATQQAVKLDRTLSYSCGV